MEIEFVGRERFAEVFPKSGSHVYNSVEFSELNRSKCDEVCYAVFADRKPRLGMVLGRRGDKFCSPFSAPFGGFLSCGEQKLEYYFEAAGLLKAFARGEGRSVEVALPPAFYGGDCTGKSVAALSGNGELMWTDVNYHYPLERCAEAEAWMRRNARKNYLASLRCGFEVEVLDRVSHGDVARVYGVVRANREWHGYPLRMTLEDVARTAPVADAELLVMTCGGVDVAAALVHRVTPFVGQVVYWGDVPGYGGLRPMNFFALEVMRHCRGLGMEVLDIGPSSEAGVPSFGLCDFKESIGCVASPKFRFRL